MVTMKAEEANQLAKDACKEEIDKILSIIKEVASEGKTSVSGLYSLRDGTKSYLLSLGYDIDNIEYINGQLYHNRIGWHNK